MLKKSHIIVSELAITTAGFEFHSSIPAVLCLMAGTYVGAQLPDIDHGNSDIIRHLGAIGHSISKMFKHRTWTHTIWAVILVALLAWFVPAPSKGYTVVLDSRPPVFVVPALRAVYYGLASGYFLHIFEDSFSKEGICWTYPLHKYCHYYNHIYKKGHNHHWWCYYTGGKYEACIRWISLIALIYVCSLIVLR